MQTICKTPSKMSIIVCGIVLRLLPTCYIYNENRHYLGSSVNMSAAKSLSSNSAASSRAASIRGVVGRITYKEKTRSRLVRGDKLRYVVH